MLTLIIAGLALFHQAGLVATPCGPDASPLRAIPVELAVDCIPSVEGRDLRVSIRRLLEKRTVVKVEEFEICVTGTVVGIDTPRGWVAVSEPCALGGTAIKWLPAKGKEKRVVNRQEGFRVRVRGANAGVTCERHLRLDGGGAVAGCMP